MPEMSRRYVVILAGGKGERFWPLSRRRTPKQLLPIVGESPMLAQTVSRVASIVPRANLYIITNTDQADAVRRVCPGLPRKNVIAEPVGRDSAAAVGLAMEIVAARDPKGVFAILPADHVIPDAPRFRADLRAAFAAAEAAPVLVTIGIKPTEPNTGYGYIRASRRSWKAGGRTVRVVEKFVEKPDLATAKRYIATGGYFWNAGMFAWSVETIRGAFEKHAPGLMAGLSPVRAALKNGRSLQGALGRAYPNLERISVDYALLEKASNVVVLAASFAWHDVGSWSAVARHRKADQAGNVRRGRAVIEEGRRNIVVGDEDHLTAVFGVDDLVVVHTPDATLVCPRDRAQDIKALLKRLASDASAKRFL
jgi:mannose-1-phosphate guanylyltransferase